MTSGAQRSKRPGRRWMVSLMTVSAMLLTGCATQTPVQPWEKGFLAKPEMGFDRQRGDSQYNEHIYSSKEAGLGSSGVGGGGCGCN